MHVHWQPGPHRPRRHPLTFTLGSGLFAIFFSLFILYIFSRSMIYPVLSPTQSENSSKPATTTATTTVVDHFAPIPTPTPTPKIEILPEPVQETGFVLHPHNHIFRKPKTLRMTWNVTRNVKSPDGVEKPVYLINGQFPGPTIEARPGDQLEINVFNHVEDDTEGLAIHWHGLLMHGANAMDGVAGVTQCAIAKSFNYTYRFTLDKDQHGTYWYHAHSRLQRADGLYGGIVIHKPSDDSNANQYSEKLLLIGDWYHWPAPKVLEWYESADHYGYEPAPDSLLINGVGAYNCSKAVKARAVNCTMLAKPHIQLPEGDRVRLRVINTGASAGFSMRLNQGIMTPIAVDGHGLVDSNITATTGFGVLYPGERLDVFLDKSDSSKDNRDKIASNALTIELDNSDMPLKNYALTRIQSFPFGNASDVSFEPSLIDRNDAVEMLSLAEVEGVALSDDDASATNPAETAVFYTTIKNRATHGNRPAGLFNHSSWIPKDTFSPPLLAIDEDDWGKAVEEPSPLQKFVVPAFNATEAGAKTRWMDLVVNNLDDKGHSFHLHGQSFYVLLSYKGRRGEQGSYNPFDPESEHQDYPRTPFNHLLKDTVYIPRMGYVVLRVPLTNEGLWLMHCHILWHQAVGMSMVMRVGNVDADAKHMAKEFCASQDGQ